MIMRKNYIIKKLQIVKSWKKIIKSRLVNNIRLFKKKYIYIITGRSKKNKIKKKI